MPFVIVLKYTTSTVGKIFMLNLDGRQVQLGATNRDSLGRARGCLLVCLLYIENRPVMSINGTSPTATQHSKLRLLMVTVTPSLQKS